MTRHVDQVFFTYKVKFVYGSQLYCSADDPCALRRWCGFFGDSWKLTRSMPCYGLVLCFLAWDRKGVAGTCWPVDRHWTWWRIWCPVPQRIKRFTQHTYQELSYCHTAIFNGRSEPMLRLCALLQEQLWRSGLIRIVAYWHTLFWG